MALDRLAWLCVCGQVLCSGQRNANPAGAVFGLPGCLLHCDDGWQRVAPPLVDAGGELSAVNLHLQGVVEGPVLIRHRLLGPCHPAVTESAWPEAYLVLLLHREVDGQFGGLSATLSREEHLVLFSCLSECQSVAVEGFGGFLISTGAWFVALLLPCGRRALEGASETSEGQQVWQVRRWLKSTA